MVSDTYCVVSNACSVHVPGCIISFLFNPDKPLCAYTYILICVFLFSVVSLYCRRHIASRFFPVQSATSSIRQNAIRLAAARNKNGSKMTGSGLTMLIFRTFLFNIPFHRIPYLYSLFSLSCEPVAACSHPLETVLAVRKSLFRVSVKPLSCPRRGLVVCPKRLFRNAGKALWGRWEGERVGR